MNNITFELPVFWPTDIEGQINELMFSDSLSLSVKKLLISVTCF